MSTEYIATLEVPSLETWTDQPGIMIRFTEMTDNMIRVNIVRVSSETDEILGSYTISDFRRARIGQFFLRPALKVMEDILGIDDDAQEEVNGC
jgi:hypothetical protein